MSLRINVDAIASGEEGACQTPPSSRMLLQTAALCFAPDRPHREARAESFKQHESFDSIMMSDSPCWLRKVTKPTSRIPTLATRWMLAAAADA